MADVPAVVSLPGDLRYKNIEELFENKYGGKPEVFCRASGRVNLIGEHIDYCGYAVLPMAIEQDMVIAARPNNTDTIRLSNTHPDQYTDFTCNTKDFVIDSSAPRWHHYFLCGYKGIVQHCGLEAPRGMDIVLDGTVPRSAGLSSSSALVCCAALATSRCNEKTLTKDAILGSENMFVAFSPDMSSALYFLKTQRNKQLEFAEVCTKSEKYIGTEGGGMDQAISFLAEPGTAKLIEFNPIRTTNITLPDGAVFVISNCCQEMNKAASGHFNTRVAECRLAAQILAKKKGLDWKACRRLGELQTQLHVSMADMVTMVTETFHKEPYTKAAVCELLGVTAEELNAISLSEKTYQVGEFQLHDRAAHVYSEAHRVWQFKRVCDERAEGAMQQLGELMDASHMSCSRMYQCSCDELDQLTAICREAGALGSRLTGAGWGGCAVSLVPVDKVDAFIAQVTDRYYTPAGITGNQLQEALFSSKPGGGAAFYTLN